MKKLVEAVEVFDVEKRRVPSKHYVYVIKVIWNDGSRVIIYRRYSAFHELQSSLLEVFPEEGGLINPENRLIPLLPGKIFFGRSHIREVALKRLTPIDNYCKLLIKLVPKISQCHAVLTFFEPSAEDINSSTCEKKPSLSTISKPKLLEQYVVLYDFTKQSQDEVNLTAGDTVEVIEKFEDGWWLVNTFPEQGYAPGNYLKRCDGQEDNQLVESNGEMYICKQSFTPEGPHDHTLEPGVIVDVIQKNLDGWWWVSINEKPGWAPATSLEPLKHQKLERKQSRKPVEKISNLSEVSDLLKGKMSGAAHQNTAGDGNMGLSYQSDYDSDEFSDDEVEEEEEGYYSAIKYAPAPKRRSTYKEIGANANKMKELSPKDGAKPKRLITKMPSIDNVGDGINFSPGQEAEVQDKTGNGWLYVKIGEEFGWTHSSYLEEVPSIYSNEPADGDRNYVEDIEEEEETEEEEVSRNPAKRLESLFSSKNTTEKPSPGNPTDELRPKLNSASSLSPAAAVAAAVTAAKKSVSKRPKAVPPLPPIRPDHMTRGKSGSIITPKQTVAAAVVGSGPTTPIPLAPPAPLPPPATPQLNATSHHHHHQMPLTMTTTAPAPPQPPLRPDAVKSPRSAADVLSLTEPKPNSAPAGDFSNELQSKLSKLKPQSEPGFSDKLSKFDTKTGSKDDRNVQTANCRGLNLLKRQQEKMKDENPVPSRVSTNNTVSTKVSSLKSAFDTKDTHFAPLPLPKTQKTQSLAPSPKPTLPSKAVLKPTVNKSNQAVEAPKDNGDPDRTVKPKVIAPKPKLGFGASPGETKDVASSVADKIALFRSGNLAEPTKPLDVPKGLPHPPLASTQKKPPPPPRLDLKPTPPPKSPAKKRLLSKLAQDPELKYRASRSYAAENAEEISFAKGTDMRVLEKDDSGWWLVKVGIAEGWAPSNHIEEVKPGTNRKLLPPNKPLPKLWPESPSRSNDGNGQQTALNANNNNNNNKGNSAAASVSRRQQLQNKNNLATTMTSCQYIALADFSAFNEDEVSIEEGMRLSVTDSSDNDWWFVVTPDGEEGWAPANCIGTVHAV